MFTSWRTLILSDFDNVYTFQLIDELVANSIFNRKTRFTYSSLIIRHHNKQIMAANRRFITILFKEILEFPIFAPTIVIEDIIERNP